MDDFRDLKFDDEPEPVAAAVATPRRTKRRAAARRGYFLGITPLQRFLLALMLLMMTCITGAMLLLVTGRFAIGF
ncbi:MAG: hypothetical protein OHK0052_17630 [Anaerolineales bacterium]